MMTSVETISPEVDSEEVPLPSKLRVVVTPEGVRFHLPAPDDDDRAAVCDRGMMMLEPAEMTVAEARERGRAACRKCFQPARSIDHRLPDQVAILVPSQTKVYHELVPGDLANGIRIGCGYGQRHADSARKFAQVKRSQVESVLRPCRGCFGYIGELRRACPLCGERLSADVQTSLGAHLQHCEARREVTNGR